jgi:hypothetical protein
VWQYSSKEHICVGALRHGVIWNPVFQNIQLYRTHARACAFGCSVSGSRGVTMRLPVHWVGRARKVIAVYSRRR